MHLGVTRWNSGIVSNRKETFPWVKNVYNNCSVDVSEQSAVCLSVSFFQDGKTMMILFLFTLDGHGRASALSQLQPSSSRTKISYAWRDWCLCLLGFWMLSWTCGQMIFQVVVQCVLSGEQNCLMAEKQTDAEILWCIQHVISISSVRLQLSLLGVNSGNHLLRSMICKHSSGCFRGEYFCKDLPDPHRTLWSWSMHTLC